MLNTPVADDAVRARIADLAEEAGIRTVHMLAWRDLDDDEAGGSEIHAHNITSIWVQSGLEVTHRTSASVGRPAIDSRSGYRVIRRGSRYSVFPVQRLPRRSTGTAAPMHSSRSGTGCPSDHRCGAAAPA
ncbi:MAG: hypothetical protein M5U19_11105 [Microthrixaceae bacterium]|nr:hypothetical protein [Microthrixaceae bacterium]